MTTAFQSNAFQNNAFQIASAPVVVDDWGSEKSRRQRIRKNQTPKEVRFDEFDDDLMAIAIAVVASGVLH